MYTIMAAAPWPAFGGESLLMLHLCGMTGRWIFRPMVTSFISTTDRNWTSSLIHQRNTLKLTKREVLSPEVIPSPRKQIYLFSIMIGQA
ncbi:MAG: hypothetical protein IPH94_15085 [Saprospiraceae bacterium]|nr:hypothetical protein [Saprospiraceae bacterium]